jgi:hypothetical protein
MYELRATTYMGSTTYYVILSQKQASNFEVRAGITMLIVQGSDMNGKSLVVSTCMGLMRWCD